MVTYNYESIRATSQMLVELENNNILTKKAKEKKLAEKSIDVMVMHVNKCKYPYLVSDADWLSFCLFFNEQVKKYGTITEELHYFRIKLNRCPENLNDMIKAINAAADVDDKWIMCSPEKGRFHMYGETGAYNIKFISSNNTDNIYEAVYDKDGKLITENDNNGKNMGTYNYASSSKDASNHNKFDVNTYKDWGNTENDPKPVNKSWNDNVIKNGFNGWWGDNVPRIKGTKKIDKEAEAHYKDICQQIGIKYKALLEKNFSNYCY